MLGAGLLPPRTSFRFTTGKSITIRSPKEEITYFPKRTLCPVIDPPITITQSVLSASGSDLQAIPHFRLNRFLRPAQKLILSTTRHAQVLSSAETKYIRKFDPLTMLNSFPVLVQWPDTLRDKGEDTSQARYKHPSQKGHQIRKLSVNTRGTSTEAKRHVWYVAMLNTGNSARGMLRFTQLEPKGYLISQSGTFWRSWFAIDQGIHSKHEEAHALPLNMANPRVASAAIHWQPNPPKKLHFCLMFGTLPRQRSKHETKIYYCVQKKNQIFFFFLHVCQKMNCFKKKVSRTRRKNYFLKKNCAFVQENFSWPKNNFLSRKNSSLEKIGFFSVFFFEEKSNFFQVISSLKKKEMWW